MIFESHGDSDWQLNVDLAHDDQEVLDSIPIGEGKFFLLFSVKTGRILPEFGRNRRIIEKFNYSRFDFIVIPNRHSKKLYFQNLPLRLPRGPEEQRKSAERAINSSW